MPAPVISLAPLALSYIDAKEKLAEKFHMSPELLVALNPDQNSIRLARP